jgi:hypothetical protein
VAGPPLNGRFGFLTCQLCSLANFPLTTPTRVGMTLAVVSFVCDAEFAELIVYSGTRTTRR